MSPNNPKQDKKPGDQKPGSQQRDKSKTGNQTPKEENQPRDRKK